MSRPEGHDADRPPPPPSPPRHSLTAIRVAGATLLVLAAVTAVRIGPGRPPADRARGSRPAPTATGTAAAPTAPGTVRGVAAWPGNGQVTISWAPPTDPGNPAVDHYGVLMYDGDTLVSAIDATSSPLVVTGLVNGQTRGYRVVASNSVGSSTDLGPLVTATPSATPFASLTSWANWVKRLIGDLEARAPTPSELSTWGAALANGTQTPASLVETLRSGTDNRSNVDPVARLYRAYFLRTPDAGGLKHWIAKRRAGTSLNAISQSFAGSNEFKTRYGRLTNAAFVKLIYKNLFARSGDPGGVTFWTHQLDARLKTRGQVMTGFSESHEYVTKQAGFVEVAAQYVLLLGRAPKPSETALATDPTLTAAWLATRVLNDPSF